MKLVQTTFLFFTLLLTGNINEEAFPDECQPGSSDYCNGWADAKEEPGDSIYHWNAEHNSCMENRGCEGNLPTRPHISEG